jgi:hypothetical protein
VGRSDKWRWSKVGRVHQPWAGDLVRELKRALIGYLGAQITSEAGFT